MRVGIVGGGITGLALLHELVGRGLDPILFERDTRPGGIIRTRRLDGSLFEVGPQRTRLVPSVRRLVEDLGLGRRVVTAREGARLHIWTRGRLRAVPDRLSGLLTSALLTPAGRLRMLVEPLSGALRSSESVADYFTRKAGAEAYRTLFGPLISATFGSDPARMPARHSLPMILRPLGVERSLVRAAGRWKGGNAPACTFADGMSELVDALAHRHGGRIQLGQEVTGLERVGSKLLVRLAAGGEEVDHVVLATPASASAPLIASLGEDAEAAAALVGGLRYNEVTIVSLQADPPQRGFGFQSAFDAPWRTRGVTWAGWLFDRGPVCTAYLGGGLDPEIATWADEAVAATAVQEFEEIHGTSAAALDVARATLPSFDDSWDPLDDLVVPEKITIAANYVGRLGISARIAQAEAVAEGLASRVA
ncbi:MAG: FAD-dependent oxidoreductase [Gemmatimonadota bacterium]|nr:FAD-dependent oxidoreductase [Gemmatimonadota bacterium]